ncbi:flagellar basal body rod protein FlgB [Gracilimonas sp. BCB1]|uniref:flagellar basal body rod protein FlgB n=1 Tax=Gracilimonas sp. BCB1 TaxID=3152362 RepID=UPI0032DD775F
MKRSILLLSFPIVPEKMDIRSSEGRFGELAQQLQLSVRVTHNQSKFSMNFIDSNHSQMLARAMDTYSLRQKVTASNIANADTPNYKRHEVLFEEELQQAQLDEGISGMKSVSPSIVQTEESVILEDEMIEMADTQIRVQMVTRSLRHHFSLLKSGITGINR